MIKRRKKIYNNYKSNFIKDFSFNKFNSNKNKEKIDNNKKNKKNKKNEI